MVEKYLVPVAVPALLPVISSVCARPNISVPVTVKVTDPLSPALVIATRSATPKLADPPEAALPFNDRLPASLRD